MSACKPTMPRPDHVRSRVQMKSKLLGIFPRRKSADAFKDQPEEAQVWFELALEQSAQLEMILPGDGTTPETVVRGTLYQIRHGRIYLEIKEHGLPLAELKGREMLCFMGVRRDGKLTFCRFSSRAVDSSVTNLGFRMALIEQPRTVEIIIRAALRIEPEDGQVLRADLWAAKLLKLGQERSLREWGPPDLEHSPDETGLRIVDLSAGGMRVRLSPRVIRRKMTHGVAFQKGRKFFLRLHLADSRQPWPGPLLLFAVIKSAALADNGHQVDVGLQFIGSARQGEDGELLWSRVCADGVPLLIDWVFQRHMDHARRKFSA